MKANLVVPDIRDNYIENLLTEYVIQELEKYLNPTFESIQNPEDFNNIKEGKTKEEVLDDLVKEYDAPKE